MDNEFKIKNDQVVSMDYTLRVDGEVVDTSEGSDPIEFIQGKGEIIKGLETQLYGMEVGDAKDVVVKPKEGYGELDENAYVDVPREQFPQEIPLEVGTQLQVQDQKGRIQLARIEQVAKDSVRLDFNHPLAGKTLHFSVKIAAMRPASDDELSHGHVHQPDSH